MLDAKIAAFLVEHQINTQISFDGIDAAQNYRGKDTFAKLDALLDQLRREHPEFYRSNITIALTLTASNISSHADSISYFLDKRVPQIAVTPIITHDPLWRHELIDELDAQYERIYENSLHHYRATGAIPLKIFQDKYEGAPQQVTRSEMCGVVSGESLVIDVGGRADGCTLLAGSYQSTASPFLRDCLTALCVGSISAPGFSKRFAGFPGAIQRTGLFHNKEEKYSSYGRCGECSALGECSACPMSIAHVPGNNDPNRVSNLVCAYNLVSRKHRQRFPDRPHPQSVFSLPPELADEMKRWESIADAMENIRRVRDCPE